MDAWVGVVAAGALLLVLLDRLVALRTPGRARAARRPATHGSGSGAFGALIDVFQPTARYLHEENETRRHGLVTPGDSEPPWHIDLEAGTAHKERPHRDAGHLDEPS
ncbi:DUF6191 domain-containing protein [Actinotalea sp. K2]|uniref:DUF6191 domain-containing protein n=1 Tax=Actinotalea sp. K2 TaxID=2939438 RepID=UPI002017C07F|nr:DUF6191 domain-containing protein [Actinotalea sp. K2]MCL3860690.1 DUF6191 domain-containing protein [Actinotalea sp. K2]